MASRQWPLRVRSQDVRGLEFHMSPVACSSRPQVRQRSPDELQYAPGMLLVAAEALCDPHGLGQIRDHAQTSAVELLAEEA